MNKDFFYIVLFPRDNSNQIHYFNGHCGTHYFEETIYFSSYEEAQEAILDSGLMHQLNKQYVPHVSVLCTNITEMILSEYDYILDEIKMQNAAHTDNVRLPDGTGSNKHQKLANKFRDICDLKCLSKEETWADIFKEEAYEVLGSASEVELKNELRQVAALCLRWIHAIDNR